jgi:hypothetical protein
MKITPAPALSFVKPRTVSETRLALDVAKDELKEAAEFLLTMKAVDTAFSDHADWYDLAHERATGFALAAYGKQVALYNIASGEHRSNLVQDRRDELAGGKGK